MASHILNGIIIILEKREKVMLMDKVVEDKLLFLMQEELKCRKSVRTVLRERLLHEDHLIIDLEKRLLEYANKEIDVSKDIKRHID